VLTLWQNTLEARKPGATIVPVIISSDRTQVTLFGSKTAYPVYLTIGNIPKDMRRKPSRRCQILLAYLPTTKLKHVTSKASRRRMLLNLFHSSLHQILKPLELLGLEGIVMKDGYGTIRRTHPILAVFIADYPEQVSVTCIKSGECPKCPVEREKLGDYSVLPDRRDFNSVRAVLYEVNSNMHNYEAACKRTGIKPVYYPFWSRLPYVDIFQSISPDILHQLHQGVFKHLLNWLTVVYSPAELDARYQRLIPSHNIRVFSNGVTGLSRITGKEHDQISRVLLGVIIDMRLCNGLNPSRLIRAVRNLLDFLYLAKLPVQTTQTLNRLNNSLRNFHENKSIFVDLGVRQHFNFPKLHSCLHYASSINMFGTTDNYDTQYTERLHIDLAKNAYRSTNTKNEVPQMALWLERREKIFRHGEYIRWCEGHNDDNRSNIRVPPKLRPERHIQMTRHPTRYSVTIDVLVSDHGAVHFRDAFARFAAGWLNPGFNLAQIERASLNINIPFTTVSVYHRIKFTNIGETEIVDVLHIQPRQELKQGHIPQRFDTALVHVGGQGIHGV
jgi:hypothetical protein